MDLWHKSNNIHFNTYEWTNILEYYQGKENKGIIFFFGYESADQRKKGKYKQTLEGIFL